MNTNNQLMVNGSPVQLDTFGGAVVKDRLVSARVYVGTKLGLSPSELEKKSMKDVKAALIAKGVSEADIKATSKEYDRNRSDFLTVSARLNGMLAADPTLRKSVRISRNKAGLAIGATTTYRRETATGTASLAAQLKAALARVQELEAKALPAAA